MDEEKKEDSIVRKDGVKICIDRELCIGAASCIILAKSVFALDDEQKAIFIDANSTNLDTIMQAAQSCPTDAITVIDKDGEQLWP